MVWHQCITSRSRLLDLQNITLTMALIARRTEKADACGPIDKWKGWSIMRLMGITASAFALALAVAAPTFAQSPQSGTGTPATHSTTTPSRSTSASGTSVRQFKTETEAKSACGSQPVVWANTSSHVLHAAGTRYYGKTKNGAYMCENTAEQAGYHMATNGQ
jgi:hypothetical protein